MKIKSKGARAPRPVAARLAGGGANEVTIGRRHTATPVAARLAGDCDLEGPDAGKPDCYGRWRVLDFDLRARWCRRRRTRRQGARPSVGVVEGDERQEPRKPCGPWMAHHGVPPERRRSRGKSDEGGPQPVANGLPTFPKESRSPVRGETLGQNHRENGYARNIRVNRRRRASFRALPRGAWERSRQPRTVSRLVLGPAMRRQPLKRRAQLGIADPLSCLIERFGGRTRQIPRMTNRRPMNCRWLNLEKQAGQIGELLELHQLTLQTPLLITQAGRPMPVRHHQQQSTFPPRRHMAMRPGSRLQLGFEQALQVGQALGVVEDRPQRPGLTQKGRRCASL